jgi:hypothetical protein
MFLGTLFLLYFSTRLGCAMRLVFLAVHGGGREDKEFTGRAHVIE